MRSTNSLQREISLRRTLDEAIRAVEVPDQWDRRARHANSRVLAELHDQLSTSEGELEWAFAGIGVYDHKITLARLTELSGAMAQTLRWTARDLILLEGRPETPDIGALVEPVVTGTFDGSFGLRVAAPPIPEQRGLFAEGSLFQRTADRIIAVFKATHAEDPEAEVVTLLTGLRRHAIAGFRNLSNTLAASGAPTWVRWRGETVVTVSTVDAELLFATLDQVVPTEEEVQVFGILEGADRDAGQFHIVVPRATGDLHYRGKAEEGIAGELTGLAIGSRVTATLVVLRLDSPFLLEPRQTYLLRHVTPAVTGG